MLHFHYYYYTSKYVRTKHLDTMKAPAMLVAATLAALASTASAAVVNSKPFYLVLVSDNSNLDGTALSTCHEGAAIESLCKGVPISKSNPDFTTFRLRKDEAGLTSGEITWLEDKQTHGTDVRVQASFIC